MYHTISFLYVSFSLKIVCVIDEYHGNEQELSKEVEPQHPRKNLALSVQDYALRCLKYNSSLGRLLQAEAPTTPDRISDCGILKNSWDENFSDLTEVKPNFLGPFIFSNLSICIWRKSVLSFLWVAWTERKYIIFEDKRGNFGRVVEASYIKCCFLSSDSSMFQGIPRNSIYFVLEKGG